MSESERKYELWRYREGARHDVTVDADYDTKAEAVAQAERDAESHPEEIYEVALRTADAEYDIVWSSRRV